VRVIDYVGREKKAVERGSDEGNESPKHKGPGRYRPGPRVSRQPITQDP